MRGGLTRTVLCACALTLAGAPAAAAAPSRVATTSDLRAGPALAANGTAWVDARGQRYAVRSSLPGGPVRTLRRRSVPRRDDDVSLIQFLRLGGSDRRLVFSEEVRTVIRTLTRRSVDSFTGSPAGPLGALSSCERSPAGNLGSLPSGAIAVSGDTVAYVDCQDRVVVRDLAAGGASRTFATPSGPDRLAVSGRYVAEAFFASPGTIRIRVSDWVAGTPAYTTDDADAFDLAQDGTLAAVRFAGSPGCSSGRLELHTPSQPAARRLSLTPCTAGVATAGARIAVVAPAANRQLALALTAADNSRRDLALIGGQGVQVERSDPNRTQTSRSAIDLDAGRAAFALKRCDERQDLFAVSVSAPGGLRPVSSRCPVSIVSRRSVLSRRGRLVVRIRCRSGCKGRAFVRIGRSTGRGAPFTFRPSRRSRGIAFRASSSVRRALRSGAVARSTLIVRTRDRAGRVRSVRGRVRLSG